ncbi:MAG: A24 family peptidase [Massilia sp.]
MNEFRALLDLLGMLIADPRTGVLLALLALAAWHDCRCFRIPNLLCAGGIIFALLYNDAVPPVPHATWFWAPAGMLLCFSLTVPMYAFGVMGAGDVKLLSMVGAFLGVGDGLQALLFSMITAGLAALAFALSRRVLRRMLANVRELLRTVMWSAVAAARPAVPVAAMASVGRLPFGLSIALGTAIWLVGDQLGFI